MPTRNVVLTDHQEQFIARLVESGRYKNASEVLREAVRVFERREAAEEAKLTALRQAIDVGTQAIAQGDWVEYTDTLLAEIDEQAQPKITTHHG